MSESQSFEGQLPAAPDLQKFEPATPERLLESLTLREERIEMAGGAVVLMRERPIGDVAEAIKSLPKDADGEVDEAAAAVDLVALFAVGFDSDEGRAALGRLAPSEFRKLGDVAAEMAFPDAGEVSRMAATFPGGAE